MREKKLNLTDSESVYDKLRDTAVPHTLDSIVNFPFNFCSVLLFSQKRRENMQTAE